MSTTVSTLMTDGPMACPPVQEPDITVAATSPVSLWLWMSAPVWNPPYATAWTSFAVWVYITSSVFTPRPLPPSRSAFPILSPSNDMTGGSTTTVSVFGLPWVSVLLVSAGVTYIPPSGLSFLVPLASQGVMLKHSLWAIAGVISVRIVGNTSSQ